MSVSFIALASAVLSGSTLPWLLKVARRRFSGADAAEVDRAEAEARKFNAEAERIDWQTLRDEIDRQTKQIRGLREEIHALRNRMTTRENELLEENKTLRSKVACLTTRVEGLESILKITPLPDDMKALLDELDRKTAKGNGA